MVNNPNKKGFQQIWSFFSKKIVIYFLPLIFILAVQVFSQVGINRDLSVDFCYLANAQKNLAREAKPGNEGMDGNHAAENRVAINISGLWESNIGWKYNIKQQGNKFTWTVINRSQKAIGTINNLKDIVVSWSDNDSKGSTVGLILEIDAQGKATFIEWDNGVFFQRIKTGT